MSFIQFVPAEPKVVVYSGPPGTSMEELRAKLYKQRRKKAKNKAKKIKARAAAAKRAEAEEEAEFNDDVTGTTETLTDFLRQLGSKEYTQSERIQRVVRRILSNSSENPFKPTKFQCTQLSRIRTRLGVSSQQTNRQWFESMGDGSALFEHITNSVSIRTDQVKRATAIVADMNKKGQTTLCTMDGHGRFVYTFFQALDNAGKDIDEYTAVLYDTDADVHNWHELFLPPTVQKIHRDIIKAISSAPVDDVQRTAVYFNFMSIAKHHKAAAGFPLEFCLKRLRQNNCEPFISFSRRAPSDRVGASESPLDQLKRWISQHSTVISERINFVTYHVKQSEGGASKSDE